MQKRPRYATQKDRNHFVIQELIEKLHYRYSGHDLYLLDTSQHGGEVLDWFLWLGPLCIAVEVKNPDRYLDYKPGEIKFFNHCPGPAVTIITEQDLIELLADLLPLADEMQRSIDNAVRNPYADARDIQVYLPGGSRRDRRPPDRIGRENKPE